MNWSKWQLIWCLFFHKKYIQRWEPRTQRCRRCGITVRGPVAASYKPQDLPPGHYSAEIGELDENYNVVSIKNVRPL